MRRYYRPLPIPEIGTIGLWISRILAIAVAITIGLWTAHIGRSMPQFSDTASHVLQTEAAYWAGLGGPPPAVFGQNYNGACGLFSWTHHPPGGTYITALFLALGLPWWSAQLDVLAAAIIVLLCLVGWKSPRGSLAVAGILFLLLTYAPGYYRYLILPYEDTWVVICFFLLAAACSTARPLWPIVLATALASATCIAATPFLAAIGAAALFVNHGIGWISLRSAWWACLTWIGVFLANKIQLLCHFGWSLSAFEADYVTGATALGGGTSLLFRISGLSWTERWDGLSIIAPQYFREVVEGKYGAWTDPIFWMLLPGVMLLVPVTWRGLWGVAVFLSVLWCGFLICPGLLPPHFHSLPRLVLLIPLGVALSAAMGHEKDVS